MHKKQNNFLFYGWRNHTNKKLSLNAHNSVKVFPRIAKVIMTPALQTFEELLLALSFFADTEVGHTSEWATQLGGILSL